MSIRLASRRIGKPIMRTNPLYTREERNIFVVRDSEGMLKEMVCLIVARFDPQPIILIGSRVGGGSARPEKAISFSSTSEEGC